MDNKELVALLMAYASDLITLPNGFDVGGVSAYIKPKQGAKVSADLDDCEFEDGKYENKDASE